MNLLFKNPVFKDGVNFTVRRGIKWALEEPFEYGFPIVDTENQIDSDGKTIIIGFAQNPIVKIFRFSDLIEKNLENEHDPQCRNYYGLLNVMKNTYDDFSENEIITIIEFNFLSA